MLNGALYVTTNLRTVARIEEFQKLKTPLVEKCQFIYQHCLYTRYPLNSCEGNGCINVFLLDQAEQISSYYFLTL